MAKRKKAPEQSGGAWSKRRRGKVAIIVTVSEAERKYIQSAAPLAGAKSMQDFVREAALFSARKVLPESHLRELEKKMANAIDKSV